MRASEYAARFGMADVLSFEDTADGLVKVDIATAEATATIFPYGAQLTAWAPAGAKPVLFTSRRSAFAPGKAIRGGIPIIFPWFGPRGGTAPSPQHGFARTALWQLAGIERDAAGAVIVTLRLEPDATITALWPEPFLVTYRVTVGSQLQVELVVENRSNRPIRFEEALHTYFAISDIGKISLTGLEGCTFIDKVDGGQRKLQDNAPMTWNGERDSVYLNTPETCAIDDPGWARRTLIRKSGAASTIAWNPGAQKGPAMADLGDEWQGMVCVECGNVADNAITLAAGATHRMTTIVALAARA